MSSRCKSVYTIGYYEIILCYFLCEIYSAICDNSKIPIDQGCFFEKNVGACVWNAYCNTIFEVPYYSNNDIDNYFKANEGCNNSIYYNNAHWMPLHVVIKDKQHNSELNLYSDNVISTFIRCIDTSNNDYEFFPNITNLENLQSFNISHNLLRVAQLSSTYNFNSLEEIDFSYNLITSIEVIGSEHPYTYLKKLDLSHNFIGELDEAFHYFSSLKYLDISYNKISFVSPASFFNQNKLMFLNLSNNKINNIDLSLCKLNMLEELYFNNNNLTRLFVKDFKSMNKLRTFDASNNVIEDLEENLFDHSNGLTTLNLRNNKIKVIDRDMFVDMESLKFIDLSLNQISNLPIGSFKDKPISYFSITGNKLQGDLKKGMFEGLSLITYLDLSYQEVTSIGDLAFLGITHVTELLLNNNKIANISVTSLRLLHYLNRLDLSNNLIVDFNFNVEDLFSVEFLSLAYNNIKYVSPDQLKVLNKLEFLDLSNNNISKLDTNTFVSQGLLINICINKNPIEGILAENTFNGLRSVPILDLSNTLLSTINNGTFSEMINLHNINISRGKIDELNYNAFINTGNIKTIDLSFNRLTKFSINTTDLVNIETIYLNNNMIKSLSDKTLKGLIHLIKFDLSNNDLFSISKKSFCDQKNLELLDLSHNIKLIVDLKILEYLKNIVTLKLSNTKVTVKFEEVIFGKLKNLEISSIKINNISNLNISKILTLSRLILSNNELTKIEEVPFKNLINLISLDISYNKIMYLQPGIFNDCESLATLNVSHNAVTMLNYGVFRGLVNLNVLDLSYNLIKELNKERFYQILTLKELIADYNFVSHINPEDFHGLSLTRLSIGNNPLPCRELIELNEKIPTLNITAITIDYHVHNHMGVACSDVDFNKYDNVENRTLNIDMKILSDIRNIFRNLLNTTTPKEDRNVIYLDRLLNVTKEIGKTVDSFDEKIKFSNNIDTPAMEEAKKTNLLLDRILKLMVAMNSFTPSNKTVVGDYNRNNYTAYIGDIKQELNNRLIIEKEKLILEFDKKLLQLSDRLDKLQRGEHVSNDMLSRNNDLSKFPFTEVIVGIVLTILLSLVAFKFYKSKIVYSVSRRSASSRQITEDVDNSNL